MKIIKIDEELPGNGYCTMHCEFSQEEVNIFIEYAINDILKKQIEKMEHLGKRKCFDCGEEIDSKTIEEFPDTEICIECMEEKMFEFPEDTP